MFHLVIFVFLCCRHELFFKTCHIMPIIIGQKCVLIQLVFILILYRPMLSFLQPVFRLLKNIFPLILYPVPHICWSQQGKKQVRRINIQRVSLSRLKQQASRKVNYSVLFRYGLGFFKKCSWAVGYLLYSTLLWVLREYTGLRSAENSLLKKSYTSAFWDMGFVF